MATSVQQTRLAQLRAQVAADYSGVKAPFKRVAGLADDLAKDCKEIAKAARAGETGKVDNWAMKADSLEAKCRLLVKHLKKAKGKG